MNEPVIEMPEYRVIGIDVASGESFTAKTLAFRLGDVTHYWGVPAHLLNADPVFREPIINRFRDEIAALVDADAAADEPIIVERERE